MTSKPLRADAQRNRTALLATARELFDAGHSDLRFDDFARLAGVGVGTLYRHFPTREALAEAVYGREVSDLCEHARQLQATLPAKQALAAFLRSMVSHIQAHPGLAHTLATLIASRPDALAEGSRALEKTVTDLLEAAVRDGAVRPDVGAGAVMMALHGISAARNQPGWQAHSYGVITLVMDGLSHSSQDSSEQEPR